MYTPGELIGPEVEPVLLVACAPAQLPVPPLPMHAVALRVDQLRVAAWPAVIEFGVIEKVSTVAVGFETCNTAVWVAVPPAPLQLSVYE
jgi:hypothetical protein